MLSTVKRNWNKERVDYRDNLYSLNITRTGDHVKKRRTSHVSWTYEDGIKTMSFCGSHRGAGLMHMDVLIVRWNFCAGDLLEPDTGPEETVSE